MTATVPVITIDGLAARAKAPYARQWQKRWAGICSTLGRFIACLLSLRYIIMWMLNPKRRWCRWLRTWMFVLSPLTVALEVVLEGEGR